MYMPLSLLPFLIPIRYQMIRSSDGLTDITGHGTQVAGIIGTCANNTIGVAGVCWNVKLLSLKIAHESGDITDFAPFCQR